MTKARAALALLAIVVLGALAASLVALSRGIDLSWSRDWIAARLGGPVPREGECHDTFLGYDTGGGDSATASAAWARCTGS